MPDRNGKTSLAYRGHPVRARHRRRGGASARRSSTDTTPMVLPVIMDPTARWIADGLGIAVAELTRVTAATEAGNDEGQLFFSCEPIEGMTLLVRHDGLRAYATRIDRQLSVDLVTEVVVRCGMRIEDKEAMSLALNNCNTDWRRWARIADGMAPRPATCRRIEFVRPADSAKLRADELTALTDRLCQHLRFTDTTSKGVLVHAVAVCQGELVAREHGTTLGKCGCDVFGREVAPPARSRERQLRAGPGLHRRPDGDYVATCYGYLSLVDDTLSVLSPLWVDEDWLQVGWMILDERPVQLDPATVRQWLAELGVRHGVLDEAIVALCQALAVGTQRRGVFPVAVGTAAIDGTDAVVDVHIDVVRRPGRRHSDGSIDFHEVNFAPNVVAGQHLVTRYGPTDGIPGVDVRGRQRPAAAAAGRRLHAGENVRVESALGREEFYATADGVYRHRNGQVTVVECLAIRGDVDFDTGNLDFDGEIFVDGSVVQGFCVTASGDLTVSGTVEPGATVTSGADVTVGRGIVGRKTRVTAAGQIHAQFAQEALLLAARDILLENSAYHARLRAEGCVRVAMSTGRHGGSIVGGETWARDRIRCCIAGTRADTRTLLVTGLDGSSARELDKLTQSIEVISQHMQSVLERFGLESIDVGHIRSMIKAATGPRRKLLAHQANQLGELVQMYQKALATRAQVRGRFSQGLDTAAIEVEETAYAGVTVRIGDHKQTIFSDEHHVRFHLRDGHLVQDDLAPTQSTVSHSPRT